MTENLQNNLKINNFLQLNPLLIYQQLHFSGTSTAIRVRVPEAISGYMTTRDAQHSPSKNTHKTNDIIDTNLYQES